MLPPPLPKPFAGILLTVGLILAPDPRLAAQEPPFTEQPAQNSPAALRDRILELLDEPELSDLDRIRRIQELLKHEEAALIRARVDRFVAELGSPEFSERQTAEKELAAIGRPAIPALEAAASDPDLERSRRSLNVLIRLAGGADETTAKTALAALERVAQSTSGSTRAEAASQLARLTQTDADRAIAALEAAGARLHRTPDGEIRSVSSLGQNLSDHELSLLVALPSVSFVTASGAGITDAGMESLARLKGLSTLSLMRSSITDEGLKRLSESKTLRRLTLGEGNYTSNGLKHLGKTRSLDSLSLFRQDPSDEDLRALAETPVRMLSLRARQLTAEQVEILKGLKNLRTLSLHLTGVSDVDLEVAGQLSSLSMLDVSNSPTVSDAGLEYLKGLRLRSLTVRGTQITDDGLKHLKGMTLDILAVDGLQITDGGMKHLKEIKGLRSVMLHNTSVTDEGIKDLREALPHQRHVYK